MILERLSEAFYFWRRHLGALFLITTPFVLISQAVQWVLGPYFITNDSGQLSGLNLGAVALALLIRPLAEGALVVQLAAIHHGQARGIRACVLPALVLYPALLAIYFVMSAAMSIGMMLLILPGIWAYARLGFAPFRVLLRGESPIVALRGAAHQSAPCQWPLMFSIVLSGAGVFLTMSLVSGVLVAILGDNAGSMLVTALLAGLAATLINVVMYRFWLLEDG